MIPITKPSIDDEDLRAVAEVLASGQLVQGPRVAEFEQAVAEQVGSRHAVAVTNCTAALQLALLALGVKPGDRVAVPTYSWPATGNVVALCGATPLFVEIERGTYNMDPHALDIALRSGPVAAVVPVHAFGGMADMPALLEISREHGIPVIEDAACALGAALDGRQAGSWGLIGCFSFHPRKAITTGEGGVLTTDDDSVARTLRILRNHGQDPDSRTPEFVDAGFNVRMTEFQAALGTSQMRKLDRIIEARRHQAEVYAELLSHSELTLPDVHPGSRHVYQSYVVLLPESAAERRMEIITALQARGVQTTIGTYHMPMTGYFRATMRFSEGAFPITDEIARRAMTLPLYEGLDKTEQEQVAEALLACI